MNWRENVRKAIQELKSISFWPERSFEEADNMVPWVSENLEEFYRYLEPWEEEDKPIEAAEERMWRYIQQRAIEGGFGRYIDQLYSMGIETIRGNVEEATRRKVEKALNKASPDELLRYLRKGEIKDNINNIASKVIRNIVDDVTQLAGKYLVCEAAREYVGLKTNYYRPLIQLLDRGIIPRIGSKYGFYGELRVVRADIPILLDGIKSFLGCIDLGDIDIWSVHPWYVECYRRLNIHIDI